MRATLHRRLPAVAIRVVAPRTACPCVFAAPQLTTAAAPARASCWSSGSTPARGRMASASTPASTVAAAAAAQSVGFVTKTAGAPAEDGSTAKGRRRSSRRQSARGSAKKPRQKPRPSLAQVKLKLRMQVEYYFSDYNIPHDKRLNAAIAADINGWVNLDLIAAYPQVQKIAALNPSVFFSTALLADALNISALLELNRARDCVRRRYAVGMQGHDFVPLSEEEARAFKILAPFKAQTDSLETALSFPPQSKEERAVVHLVAHVLGLQHQSQGKGAGHRKQRYVTVRKRPHM